MTRKNLPESQIPIAQSLERGSIRTHDIGIERLSRGDQPGIVLTETSRRPPLEQSAATGLGEMEAVNTEPLQR